ncbi:MAG: hypothetical protein RL134_415 [Actinomycetota bacterium]|jgi:hypothetical protein
MVTGPVWHSYDGHVDTIEITEVTLSMIVLWSILIGVAAIVAYWVYRSMDRPRLRLTPTPEGPRAMRRDVILYAVTTPVLIVLWWAFFFTVLLVNANEINAAQLVIFPIALIIAIRTLAFVTPHAAHELAKVVPVALIAFVILDGNIRSAEEIGEMLDAVAEIDVAGPALLLLFAYDYLLTTIWYWGWIRWGRPRWESRKAAPGGAARSGEHVAYDDGGVTVLADANGADGST